MKKLISSDRCHTCYGSSYEFNFVFLQCLVKPKILASPAPGYNFTSGETANFNCGFESSPKILKWKYTAKDGTVTEVTAASTGVMTLDGTNLKINPVAVEHEGAALECIGQNDFGNVSASTKIEVVYGKYFLEAQAAIVKVTHMLVLVSIFMEGSSIHSTVFLFEFFVSTMLFI